MAAYALDANPQWVKIASFTETSISIANTVATVTCDPLQSKGGGSLIVHDCLVRVNEVFDGAGTVTISVGKTAALTRFANVVDGETLGDSLGSGTSGAKAAYAEAKGVIPLITITSSSGDISTFTTGKADVYLLVSAAP